MVCLLLFTIFISLVRADLVGLYSLDASQGIIAEDSSPVQNHGIIVHGNSGWVPNGGKIGGAFNFSNVCGSFQRLVSMDYTLMFWMKTTNNGTNTNQWYYGLGLVDAEVASATTDFGTSLFKGSVGFGLGPLDTTISSKTFVSDGNWHHVAAVRSVTTSGNSVINSLSLYIDGTEDIWIVQAPSVNIQPRDAAPDISFGCIQETRKNYFPGLLDQIRIYNNSVSAEDIQNIYNLEVTGVLPSTASPSTASVPPTRPTAPVPPTRPTTFVSSRMSPSYFPTGPSSYFSIPTTTSATSSPEEAKFKTAEIFAVIFGIVALIESIALVGLVLVLLKRRRVSYFQMDNLDQSMVVE